MRIRARWKRERLRDKYFRRYLSAGISSSKYEKYLVKCTLLDYIAFDAPLWGNGEKNQFMKEETYGFI